MFTCLFYRPSQSFNGVNFFLTLVESIGTLSTRSVGQAETTFEVWSGGEVSREERGKVRVREKKGEV